MFRTSTIQIHPRYIPCHNFGGLYGQDRVGRAHLVHEPVLFGGVDAVDDLPLFIGVFDAVCARVDGACGVEDSAVDGFRAPDEVRAMVEGDETSREFAYTDHGRQDDFVIVVEGWHFTAEDASLCRRWSEETTPESCEIQDARSL